MSTTIERMAAAAGHYVGEGDGAESGPFTATIDVRAILDGLGVEIVYEAVDPAGERLHIERTTLARGMIGGRSTLFVLCDELGGMAQLAEVSTDTFGNSAGNEGFDLQIEVILADDDELTYVWSWGPPGTEMSEQSRAVVRRQPATTA